jgi:ureidoglycolate lyase
MTKIKELTQDSFSRYGSYANMIRPNADKIGEEPIEFYRDIIPLDVGARQASFSVCRVLDRPKVVDLTEFHNTTEEGILPLDADVLLHVAPATPDGEPPLKDIEIFRVPRGTFVRLRKGVWHHAPFVIGAEEANVLIVLAERVYAIDCEVREIPRRQQVKIES